MSAAPWLKPSSVAISNAFRAVAPSRDALTSAKPSRYHAVASSGVASVSSP
jgi:hypothetical protein